jgi:hypothetical protein
LKEKALTGGGLEFYELLFEKLAEVIVATSNEPLPKINGLKVEVLQGSEGLNIKQLLCRIDPPTGGSYRQMQQERR